MFKAIEIPSYLLFIINKYCMNINFQILICKRAQWGYVVSLGTVWHPSYKCWYHLMQEHELLSLTYQGSRPEDADGKRKIEFFITLAKFSTQDHLLINFMHYKKSVFSLFLLMGLPNPG